MKQLNEYKLSELDVQRWKENWDGNWNTIPNIIHEYVLNNIRIQSEKSELILKKLLDK